MQHDFKFPNTGQISNGAWVVTTAVRMVQREILRGPIFVIFADDSLTAKIKTLKKLDCTGMNACVRED